MLVGEREAKIEVAARALIAKAGRGLGVRCHECGNTTDNTVTVLRHAHLPCEETYTGPSIDEELAALAAALD